MKHSFQPFSDAGTGRKTHFHGMSGAVAELLSLGFLGNQAAELLIQICWLWWVAPIFRSQAFIMPGSDLCKLQGVHLLLIISGKAHPTDCLWILQKRKLIRRKLRSWMTSSLYWKRPTSECCQEMIGMQQWKTTSQWVIIVPFLCSGSVLMAKASKATLEDIPSKIERRQIFAAA